MRLFEKKTMNVYWLDGYVQYPFDVGADMLEMAGKDMEASKATIPAAHFDGNWCNVVDRNGRGVDRLDFLLYVVPTLLIPRLNADRTARHIKTILNQLVIACHICLQWEITEDERKLVRQ
jgi:hypothetical protein